jgi:hypothetical protein
VTLSRLDIEDFIERVREHYLDQFREFVAMQRQTCTTGSPELKLQLAEGTGLYRDLYCIDFIKNPTKPEMLELQPDRYLGFVPIVASFGRMTVRIVGLRWNNAIIMHDKPDLQPESLADWFETWFDPDDKRHDATVELSGVIHSLCISGQSVSVDLGSAPVDAFWSLLEALEAAGATEIRISDKDNQPAG